MNDGSAARLVADNGDLWARIVTHPFVVRSYADERRLDLAGEPGPTTLGCTSSW